MTVGGSADNMLNACTRKSYRLSLDINDQTHAQIVAAVHIQLDLILMQRCQRTVK